MLKKGILKIFLFLIIVLLPLIGTSVSCALKNVKPVDYVSTVKFEDNINYPFVNDPDLIGNWTSVDYVASVDEFNPEIPASKVNELYLKELQFMADGKMNPLLLKWTRGHILNSLEKTDSHYAIKNIQGVSYLIFEWKSGDYTLHRKVYGYYVLKKDSQKAENKITVSSKEASVDLFCDIRQTGLPVGRVIGKDVLSTLWFSQSTIMSDRDKISAKELIEKGMNPGLGVRDLHKKGITGKGINVAIIDQNLVSLDHPEFIGKVVEYYDTGCNVTEGSMHGPAVLSLLVGENIGTAPDAKVYFAAAPSWKGDAHYFALALEWIIKKNNELPAGQKIKAVSVSAAPSGKGSPFTKNMDEWDASYDKASKAGILVLDCTEQHGIISACYYDPDKPDDVSLCTPGFPPNMNRYKANNILAPTSYRTQAEEYIKGKYSYQYTGRGGLSWGIPYVTGVLAMGWQINPGLSINEIINMLFQSAYTGKDGIKIIDPDNFIKTVKAIK